MANQNYKLKIIKCINGNVESETFSHTSKEFAKLHLITESNILRISLPECKILTKNETSIFGKRDNENYFISEIH